MGDIYAMQRANGDVFALDHNAGFCVPLFHGSSDAMTARSRNVDMLLFKPIALDDRLLRDRPGSKMVADEARLTMVMHVIRGTILYTKYIPNLTYMQVWLTVGC